jgi:aryl-alcohol dehydrogenase-like predicted oxidoreductase
MGGRLEKDKSGYGGYAYANFAAANRKTDMEYRNLGASGLKVSPLCLGAMMFGGRTNEADTQTIVSRAAEQGVNFIDTADAYCGGESEAVVGRAIRQRCDWWVLATKLANPTGEGPNGVGLSRRWVLTACENSLKRLATDHIDVYYLHKEDHETPLEETVRAMGDLIAQGKVRYFGVSNYRSWRIAEICHLCDGLGVPRPIVSQPLYNILNRQVETEHLPTCDYYGLGVFPYSPLARGILTAKYDPDTAPAGDSRAGVADKRMMETEWRPESLSLARDISAYAESRGMTAVQFAIAWVLRNQLITGVVAGPRTMEQWESYRSALDAELTDEDEAFIDARVVTGHPSTPGYNDPAYPIEGRITS